MYGYTLFSLSEEKLTDFADKTFLLAKKLRMKLLIFYKKN